MYNLSSLIVGAAELGINVYLVPNEDNSAKAKQGIHLLMPSERELMDSIETAERDGFIAIYIHNQF